LKGKEDDMPSLDVVSKVDMQALDNAVNNTKRQIASRYDFKNVVTEIEFDKKKKTVSIATADDWKAKEIIGILTGQCVKLGVNPKSLEVKPIEAAAHSTVKADVAIKEGISKDTCQKMVKFIKGLNMKVQPAIQDEQVRITGKQIDDLREVMQKLTEQDFGVPLQFVNMKS
jgi:cyclic-di-GMP-binding protein